MKHFPSLFFYFSLILLFTAVSCSTGDKSFIPKEYSYPEKNIGEGKTFIYQKEGTTEQSTTKLGILKEGGRTYLINRHFTPDNKVIDSSVALGDKIIAFYSFNNKKGIPLPAEVKLDTVMRNGNKYGVRTRRMLFKTDEYATDNTSDQEYVKDTIMLWKGKKIDCIEMKATSSTQLYLNVEGAPQQIQSTHLVYFGKGLGLIRYTSQFRNEYYVFNLIEIR
jgi:hypothetical protein